MKLTSHLIIENQKYRLITCEYEFTRPINAYGRVCGRSSEGALIYIILVSPDDNDLLFHEWLHKVDERKDGTIIFSTDGNNPSVKMLNFESAYCVDIREIFSRQNPVDTQMLTEIVISAGKITFGNKESEKKFVPLVKGTSEDALAYEGSELNSKEIISPFDDAGKLKPNIKYKSGEFGYDMETDSLGRLSRASTDNLRLTGRTDRLKHNPKTPGKLGGDHAGHLFGDRFGGSPELDNLVSQARSVNLSEFKKIENKWTDVLKPPPKEVTVDIIINYTSDELRPSSFDVRYTIDGKKFSQKIKQ